MLDGGGDPVDQRLVVEHVHADAEGLGALGFDLGDGGVQRTRQDRAVDVAALALVDRARRHGDVVAGLRELHRGGLPDAPGGSRHQCHRTFFSHGRNLPACPALAAGRVLPTCDG